MIHVSKILVPHAFTKLKLTFLKLKLKAVLDTKYKQGCLVYQYTKNISIAVIPSLKKLEVGRLPEVLPLR